MDEALDLLVQTGYRKRVAYLTLGDVPSVSNALVEYHCLIKVKAAMDQFRNGLKALGFLEMIQNCPAIWKPLFVPDAAELTAGNF